MVNQKAPKLCTEVELKSRKTKIQNQFHYRALKAVRHLFRLIKENKGFKDKTLRDIRTQMYRM